MENEPIKSYDIPETRTFTSDEASSALKKIYADAVDTNHPYCLGAHPQHKDFLNVVKELHEIKADGQENKLETAMQEAEEYKEKTQADSVKRAQVLVNELTEKHNFEPFTVGPDVKDYQIKVWEMQKQQAEKDFTALSNSIGKELRLLNTPSGQDIMNAVSTLTNSVSTDRFSSTRKTDNIDSELRKMLTTKLIEYVLKEHKKKDAEFEQTMADVKKNKDARRQRESLEDLEPEEDEPPMGITGFR